MSQIRSSPLKSAANGGHIRVGLEDNVRMPGGDPAKGSYEQVRWAGEVARLAGRELASSDEAGQIFHIPKKQQRSIPFFLQQGLKKPYDLNDRPFGPTPGLFYYQLRSENLLKGDCRLRIIRAIAT
jgi:beta-keto acid cleavage enzyme